MRTNTKVRTGLRGLEPAALKTLRAALDFSAGHDLQGGLPARIVGYRRARWFALDLLPRGLTLDGLVVDVGANEGHFTATVRKLDRRARVLAIEPCPAAGAKLASRFDDDPRVTIDNRAVSDKPGVGTLYVTAKTELSSLRRPLSGTSETYQDAATVTDTVNVDVTTLDDIVTEPVRLLKIDVQGEELAVLDGARRTLLKTSAILLETNFVSHYDGDATFSVLDNAMRDRGFYLAAIGNLAGNGHRVLYGDACYVLA